MKTIRRGRLVQTAVEVDVECLGNLLGCERVRALHPHELG